MNKRFINRPRLKGFDYRGELCYHLTLVTDLREPVLRGELALAVIKALLEAAEFARFSLLVY